MGNAHHKLQVMLTNGESPKKQLTSQLRVMTCAFEGNKMKKKYYVSTKTFMQTIYNCV